jgi:hypothetical protein
LNKPGRWFDNNATTRLLADFQNRSTIEAHLLREGYPVLCSNRVDPFAASNYRQSLPILETMTGLGIPISIQTRGGFGVDEALDFLPPSTWYISITSLDDEVRKRVEPGAPTPESRFELLAKLKERGHRSIVALNPLVPEWCPDATRLLERAQAAGAEGAWIEALHLSRRQADRMSPRELTNVGPEVIREASRSAMTRDDGNIQYAIEAARDLGLLVNEGLSGARSDFHKLYRWDAPTFPTLQDFINHCHDTKRSRDEWIDFDEFNEFFASQLPAGTWPIGHYVTCHKEGVVEIPNRASYSEVLAVMFANLGVKSCPAKASCFAYAGRWDRDGWLTLVDDEDLPFLVFDPCGFDDYHVAE